MRDRPEIKLHRKAGKKASHRRFEEHSRSRKARHEVRAVLFLRVEDVGLRGSKRLLCSTLLLALPSLGVTVSTKKRGLNINGAATFVLKA